jgi:hypothetical protein
MAGVYHRDVAGRLIRLQAQGPDAFEWQRQVRHQWEEGADEVGRARCLVRSGPESLTYGFEYLGDRGVGMAFAATAKPASPVGRCKLKPLLKAPCLGAWNQHQ